MVTEKPLRSGEYMRQLITEGKSTTEVLRLNKKAFPSSKATEADVAYQRAWVRRGGPPPHKLPKGTKRGRPPGTGVKRANTGANVISTPTPSPTPLKLTHLGKKAEEYHFKKERFSAVGAYIFAGGFTLGMSRHLNVMAHLEEGNFGVATFQENFPNVPVFTDPRAWPLDSLAKAYPDVVYANPPCAAWSRAGRLVYEGMDAWKTSDLPDCTRRAFHLLGALRPRVWIWESVTEAYYHGTPFVKDLTKRAQKLGYSVDYLLIENARIGLPQWRKRFLFVARDIAINWPVPADKIVTAGEILKATTPSKSPKLPPWSWVLKHVKQGDSVRKVWESMVPPEKREVAYASTGRQRVVGRPGFLYRRLKADEPCYTITGGVHFIHPRQNRLMSPAENAALCGFPAEYQFPQTPSTAYAEIGKGVSPIMGDYIGKAVRDALDNISMDPWQTVREVNMLEFGESSITVLS